jgi:hypothetical protein
MECMNCSTDVDEGSATLMLNVYLCKPCGRLGNTLRAKARMGLDNALATMDDSIRQVLLNRERVLDAELVDALRPAEALVFLLATREKSWATPSAITKPSAITAAGTRNSESPKALG